jgi:hypothetical protein
LAAPKLPQLREILTEDDPAVRLAAASAILRIRGSDDLSLDVIIALLPDGDIPLRVRAAQFLGELGPSAEKALPALRDLCNSDKDDLAAAAKDAIAKLTVARAPVDSTMPASASSDRNSPVEWKWLAALGGLLLVSAWGVRVLIRRRTA